MLACWGSLACEIPDGQKLMPPHARSISGVHRAVHDTKLDRHANDTIPRSCRARSFAHSLLTAVIHVA
jgi:hypothetical protein